MQLQGTVRSEGPSSNAETINKIRSLTGASKGTEVATAPASEIDQSEDLRVRCRLIREFSALLPLFPYLAERPAAFAVVGMAAFFTAVVRAPATGIILVTEMTGCFTLLLPMLLAYFAAMAVPTLLGDPPIYDRLRRIGSAANHSLKRSEWPTLLEHAT